MIIKIIKSHKNSAQLIADLSVMQEVPGSIPGAARVATGACVCLAAAHGADTEVDPFRIGVTPIPKRKNRAPLPLLAQAVQWLIIMTAIAKMRHLE